MKRILLTILCLILLLSAVGCGTSHTDPDTHTNKPTTDLSGESGPNQYVVDPVINRFILAFEKQNRYVLAGLTQNADLSCTAYLDVCQVTMHTTEHGLHFSLTGGDTEAVRNRMLDIFYSIAQVTDTTATNSQMDAAVSYLQAQTETITNHRVSNYVTVNAYVPIVNMDTVRVDCRMDFTATNYRPEEE